MARTPCPSEHCDCADIAQEARRNRPNYYVPQDLASQVERDAAAAEVNASRIIAVEISVRKFMAAGISETPALLMARAFYGTEYA